LTADFLGFTLVSMNSAPEIPKTVPAMPLAALEHVAAALGNPIRWKMLKELSVGEAREIGELAKAAGCSYASAIKHLAVLNRAGLALQGRGRLWQIPKHHLPAPGEGLVDTGHCVLRLNAAG
jgi:hypothetical protein